MKIEEESAEWKQSRVRGSRISEGENGGGSAGGRNIRKPYTVNISACCMINCLIKLFICFVCT